MLAVAHLLLLLLAQRLLARGLRKVKSSKALKCERIGTGGTVLSAAYVECHLVPPKVKKKKKKTATNKTQITPATTVVSV